MIHIDINKALKSHDEMLNLQIQCAIEEGSFVSIYGPSGAGKTSTLRLLAGLMEPDHGTIIVSGESWYNKKQNINLSPQKRNVALVFQDYALFPNMTVQQNLEFALQDKSDKTIIFELMDIMEIRKIKDRKPLKLSGGEKQRVALARAIVQRPKILLLDEPLAALDHILRKRIQEYISKVHKKYALTTLLISHDIPEIVKLSDQVLCLEKGQIVKKGAPLDVFINKEVSGKFKFVGELLKIEKQEVVYILSILIHSNIIKVIAVPSEVSKLEVGDKVLVASKAFNPIIYKL